MKWKERSDSLTINYSQCWEDPLVLMKALQVNEDDVVLSITSGGDNTLAISFEKPKEIISIDRNEAQNHLLEFKLNAAKKLEYQEFLELLGFAKSSRRIELFKKIEASLSLGAKKYFRDNQKLIELGVVHGGRFERFLKIFRKFILPLVHSKKTISEFISFSDISLQRNFYRSVWKNFRWRIILNFFLSRILLDRLARQPGMFKYAGDMPVSRQYMERLEKNLDTFLVKDNYFIQYCFAGSYIYSRPPYLDENNFFELKKNTTSLIIVSDSILNFLKLQPENKFSKFNLSDIFEPLSDQENYELWKEIIRTAKPGAIVAYWNNLVPRSFPVIFSKCVVDERELALQLRQTDRAFFYGNFHMNRIVK